MILLALSISLTPLRAWGAVSTSAPTVTTNTSSPTSHTVNLASCAAGNILMFFATFDGGGETPTWPTGTGITTQQLKTRSDATGVTMEARYRRTTGDEPSSFTGATAVTTSVGIRSAFHVYCVTGAHASTDPEAGATVTQVTTQLTCDPPSLDPSWDSSAETTLWFVTSHTSSSVPLLSSAPTNYTGNNTDTSHGSGRLESSWRTAATSAEDPGVYTYDANHIGYCETYAVEPSTQSQAPRSMHQYRLRRAQ